MIDGLDSIASGTYVDSIPGISARYGFLPSYTPPDFISWFSGDRAGILRPEIQISFTKDSIQGTFAGRLINILYYNSIPDTTYQILTNGKFKIRIKHSSIGG